MKTLAIARICHWRYDWVESLDHDVYLVLCEELAKEHTARERQRDIW